MNTQVTPLVDIPGLVSRKKLATEQHNSCLQSLLQIIKNQEDKTIVFSFDVNAQIYLEKAIREVFHYQKLTYPENGLILEKIEIFFKVHQTGNGELTSFYELSYLMSIPEWSGSIPLNNLSFHDETLRMVDNSMGICYEPKFRNKEDYEKLKSIFDSVTFLTT
jgi:hypothetical protein